MVKFALPHRLSVLGRMTIRARLIRGFAALAVSLGGAVATTLWKISGIGAGTDRVVALRVPTAFASTGLVNDGARAPIIREQL